MNLWIPSHRARQMSAGMLIFAAAAACSKSAAPASGVGSATGPAATATATAIATAGATPGATAGNGNAASGNASTAATAPIPLPPTVWPYIGFVNDPGGNDPKAVALSFDDGPDGIGSPEGQAGKTNMSLMLDQLDAVGAKATFFLCANMWTNILTDPLAQTDVKRMVASGHHFGNHTLDHQVLNSNTMTSAQAQNETVQNQALYTQSGLLGANSNFTMWRAPYGTPFQDGITYPPTAASLAAEVGPFGPPSPPNAVHIGWGIDSKDWMCAQNSNTAEDPNCILDNVNAFLDQGASGVILMHTVYKLSAQTLPAVVQTIASHGYHIVMVEDFIKAKYGGLSADVAQANSAASFNANDMTAAAIAAAKTSKWYLQINEN